PPRVGAHGVDGQADDLRVALRELILEPGEVAELGRADRRVILWVREQDAVAVAEIVVETDGTLRRLGREVRRDATDGKSHSCLPLIRDGTPYSQTRSGSRL